jgi:hypothetical protein
VTADFPASKRVHRSAVDPETHRVDAPEHDENEQTLAGTIVYQPVVN